LPDQDLADLKMHPQRNPLPWETLSDEDWDELRENFGNPPTEWFAELTDAIEKKLREKNT
jgi:hypothetical protein